MSSGFLLYPARIADLSSAATARRSAFSRRGGKCSTMTPCALIRASRASVRSQSRGEKCHSRDSTSAATPAPGHQASGFAMNVSP